MGWLSAPFNKRYDCRYKRIEMDYFHPKYVEIVEKGRVGSVFYYAVKSFRSNFTFGCVVLTSMDKGWLATKLISEDMGPFNCKAPKKVLNALSPLTGENICENSKSWRDKCFEWHEERKKVNQFKKVDLTLKAIRDIPYHSSWGGDMTIPEGSYVNVVKYGKSGRAIEFNGTRYQFPRNPLNNFEIVDEGEIRVYNNLTSLFKGERIILNVWNNADIPMSKQIDLLYQHGGGWNPLKGWKVIDFENGVVQFSDEDGPTHPIARTTHGDRNVFFYDYAFIGEFHADGKTFEIDRID